MPRFRYARASERESRRSARELAFARAIRRARDSDTVAAQSRVSEIRSGGRTAPDARTRTPGRFCELGGRSRADDSVNWVAGLEQVSSRSRAQVSSGFPRADEPA